MAIAIAALLTAVYFLWKVLAFFVEKMTQINPAISAAIIGAMATVIAGIVAVLITQQQTKSREIAEAHREKKAEIYKEYMETISKMLLSSNEKVKAKPITEVELVTYMMKFKTQIILWGGPKVIKAQYEFERASRQDRNILIAADNLYRSIREDIGLSNRDLPSLQLVKMYLSNPEEIDKPSGANSK